MEDRHWRESLLLGPISVTRTLPDPLEGIFLPLSWRLSTAVSRLNGGREGRKEGCGEVKRRCKQA